MSTSLYWIPNTPIEGNPLPDKLKYTLAQELLDSDGSLYDEIILDKSHTSYLQGLLAGFKHASGDYKDDEAVKGIEEILQAIKKHNSVSLEWRG